MLILKILFIIGITLGVLMVAAYVVWFIADTIVYSAEQDAQWKFEQENEELIAMLQKE